MSLHINRFQPNSRPAKRVNFPDTMHATVIATEGAAKSFQSASDAGRAVWAMTRAETAAETDTVVMQEDRQGGVAS